jgi:IMP dehydrogenase/GMP reductase
MKLDWKDIAIMPSRISDIGSRNEIDLTKNKLPLFTSPMDTVIDVDNIDVFSKRINICLPRKIYESNEFCSYSLDDIYDLFKNDNLPKKVLIDVANGNMSRIINISKDIKNKYGSEIELMVGNIANPETFEEYCKIGVDYVRCGIGGGSACLTAQNVGVFYPMASLIIECSKISDMYNRKTKIIADGGFREYSEIIKALACGADFVMLGGILSKSLESCGESYKEIDGFKTKISKEESIISYKNGESLYKMYRGMSTKEVQRDWGKSKLTTSEGIVKFNKVEYTLDKWIENFEDYLKSCMSYTNSRTLDDFIGKVEIVEISNNSYDRFSK